MKKLIILISLIFLTSGCYDYVELNNLSIISGISIDYVDDKFLVGYEILNEQKQGTDATTKGTIIVEGKGKNIAEAFLNTAKETPKKPYYAHLKTLIISEEIATNKLENIIDFFLRNTDIRSEFNTVIAKDTDALDMLSSNNKNQPVISDLIETLLNSNKYYKNNTSTAPFEEMVTDILIYGNEAEMAVIEKSGNTLSVRGIGIFNEYKLQGILTPEESITYNVLTGNVLNASYTTSCDENSITLGIYKSKPEIKVADKKIDINLKLFGSVIESNCDYNFKDSKTYDKLNKEYAELIKKKVYEFINTTKTLDSDILGIRRSYYIDSRKKNKNIWKTAKYNVNVDLKINKKGLIFEVHNDN